jgi:hypothetical protein
MMHHPHLPGPQPVPVPDIGFALAIPVPEVLDAPAFADFPASARPIERITWVPSPRPWFGFRL